MASLRWIRAVLWLALTIVPTARVVAADHFLTIGGGHSPIGNQVSLEKNVAYFRLALTELSLGAAPHDVFFSDGDDPARDVQYADPDQPTPRAIALAAAILGDAKGLDYSYRTHELPAVRGATSPENIDRWFQDEGARLQAGDRLVIYVTGHGNKSKEAQNPFLYLWNRRPLHVKELTSRLDRLPAGVQVVLVMVQCYSGGFANVIFNEADAAKGVAAADRCAFLATVHDRPAAGCTPDIREQDYREYSSSFWAAICGRARTGEPAAAIDVNGDGAISFAEAHAHTVLTSDTIDIPVKSSDALLRSINQPVPTAGVELLSVDSPYDTLLAAASPVDRIVLEGLSAQLNLTGADRSRPAREAAEAAKRDHDEAERERQQIDRESEGPRQALAAALKRRWPEFETRWHPRLAEILAQEGAAIVELIEGSPQYTAWNDARTRVAAAAKRKLDADRRWAKTQRYLRTAESVALAANLSRTAPADLQGQYARLIAAEGGVLGSRALLPAGK